ncbi:unnamed protein product, partial [Didymodactylos carnosus]
CFAFLPDLVIFEIFQYLKPAEILQSFFDLYDSWLPKLIDEKVCLKSVDYLSNIPSELFIYICAKIIPKIGSTILFMTINEEKTYGQLKLINDQQLFRLLPSLTTLKLFHIINLSDLEICFELCLKYLSLLIDLTVGLYTNRFVLKSSVSDTIHKYIFNGSLLLEVFKLVSPNSCRLQLPNVKQNNLRCLTISLERFSDIFILFDNLPVIEYLSIELSENYIFDESDVHDYDHNLTEKLPCLKHFTFISTVPHLPYKLFEMIIQDMIHLQQLSFKYVASGSGQDISGIRLKKTLSKLINLTRLDFLLIIAYRDNHNINDRHDFLS